jgi:adenylate cyclase
VHPVVGGSGRCCAACGNGLRASARFCDLCGARVDSTSGTQERKHVTVLFADVVGSMKLAAALDAERLREIMHELFNRSAAVVQRYNGTVDKFTGDGLMALFGAPAALEDHALRACIAALEIQSVARQLAVTVRQRDGMELRMRIGINSGEVIAGDIGSVSRSYTAIGHTVGMAQRMEAAADPGEVLCSAATARLVEHCARLGPADRVAVKGADEPVLARRLEGIESDRQVMGRDDGPLMGRNAELAKLINAFHRRDKSVVSVVGEPGLGKSRLLRELATAAASCEIVVTRCEAHTAHVPLWAWSRMLRAVFGIRHFEAAAARKDVIGQLDGVVDPDSDDAALLFDFLSIGDPAAATPTKNTDARRHRLIELIGGFVKNRSARTLFIVEDLHWVDPASDDFIAELAQSLTTTGSMLVASLRPEYDGRLRDTTEMTVTLTPLTESTTIALASELIGEQPTALGAAELIAQPSAGNPFFIEEIVRDLVGRGVLRGNRGNYQLIGSVESFAVPPTVQAVLAARIDRLTISEKSILNAAAVVGNGFDLDDLSVLLPGMTSDDLRGLVSVELVDQTHFLPEPRYAFRHPLVRAVCYESQLSATRTECHRQLAVAIEARNPLTRDENSGLIAHHLEAAGELASSYVWHMRSGDWLKHRDVVAARNSWQRAQAIADRLPVHDDEATDRRIAPRARLAATAWFVGADSEQCYDELQGLTRQSGDVLSLALGMSGRLTSLIITEGRIRDAAVMASELERLIGEVDASGGLKAELLMAVAFAQYEGCKFEEALQTTDRLRAIPEANGDDVAPAASVAGVMKVMTGRRAQGQRDLDFAVGFARELDPVSYAIALAYKTDLVVQGFDLADEHLVNETRVALRLAESFGDPYGLSSARLAHGTALLRSGHPDRDVGMELLQLSRSGGIDINGSVTDAELAAAMARDGQGNTQIGILRTALQSELDRGETLFTGFSVSVLVELLVDRGAPDDLAQAGNLVDQLEHLIAVVSLPALELWPLQCLVRLAKARRDAATYAPLATRYRKLAEELDARGHIAIARRLAGEST